MSANSPHTVRRAFTLIELLVVIAIITILAAILMPVFNKARSTGQTVTCLNQLKQIGTALSLYRDDNDDVNSPNAVCGSPQLETGYICASTADCNANTCPSGSYFHLWMHLIHPYVRTTAIFNCPSHHASPVAGAFGVGASTAHSYTGQYTGFLGYGRNVAFSEYPDAAITHPSSLITIADSAYYLAIPNPGDGSIPVDVVQPLKCGAQPSIIDDRHNSMVNIVYYDGHVKSTRPTAVYDRINGWTCFSCGYETGCNWNARQVNWDPMAP